MTWHVFCSQFVQCRWKGVRKASTREAATAKPCPHCGNQVVA